MLHQMPREFLISQITNGLILVLLGMGFVFVFLTLLVFTTKLLSSLARRFTPKEVVKVKTSSLSASAKEAEIAAAITAAVAQSKN